jgi:hypothetical protein
MAFSTYRPPGGSGNNGAGRSGYHNLVRIRASNTNSFGVVVSADLMSRIGVSHGSFIRLDVGNGPDTGVLRIAGTTESDEQKSGRITQPGSNGKSGLFRVHKAGLYDLTPKIGEHFDCITRLISHNGKKAIEAIIPVTVLNRRNNDDTDT